jgi:hypothetical protein
LEKKWCQSPINALFLLKKNKKIGGKLTQNAQDSFGKGPITPFYLEKGVIFVPFYREKVQKAGCDPAPHTIESTARVC